MEPEKATRCVQSQTALHLELLAIALFYYDVRCWLQHFADPPIPANIQAQPEVEGNTARAKAAREALQKRPAIRDEPEVWGGAVLGRQPNVRPIRSLEVCSNSHNGSHSVR